MEIEYINEFKKAVENSDRDAIQAVLRDFDKVYNFELLDLPENRDKYLELDKDRRRIVVEIHNRLENGYHLFEGLNINYLDINLGLMEYIVFNNTSYFLYKYGDAIIEKLKDVDKVMLFQTRVVDVMKDIVEGQFYKGMKNSYDKKLVTYDFWNYVENKLEDLFYIVDGIFVKSKIKEVNKGDYYQKENINEKFIGNPLAKRSSERLNQYKAISQTIKIIDTEFSYISGVQKFACEMYGVEPSSYSKWKNSREKNQEIVDSWNNNISEDEKQKIRVKINKELKK